MGRRAVVVGVLADTHGHLYPMVKRLLEGVDNIVHAGDIGSSRVLAELAEIAPVTAVRGNCDLDPWTETLPCRAELDVAGAHIVVGHMAGRLDAGPADVVITGHTHLAAAEERSGTLYLNPGAAGPARFGRPRTLALLTIEPPECAGRPSLRVEILSADDQR